jgi:hypothetical protein
LTEEIKPEPSALKKVKRLISGMKNEGYRGKEYAFTYEFTAPSNVSVTLTINRYLSEDNKDEYEFAEKEFKQMAESERFGDAHAVEDGNLSWFAGDVVRALASDVIKSKGKMDWEHFVSQIQLDLTFTVPGK